MNAYAPTPLAYNGQIITDKGDDLCLTDMWKACGSPVNKEPWNWTRKEGASFVSAVALGHNLTEGQVIKAKKGKGGSTFAHWQAGMAYAQYLDHDFHMWCNTAAREKMEGKPPSLPADAAALIARTDGIVRQMHHKVTGIERDNAALRVTVARLEAKIEDAATGFRRAGVPAKAIWDQYLQAKLKNGTLWLGNRLERMGAALELGLRADIGGKAVRLFDPDKARHCMENGLLSTAKAYIAERQGQGRLKLVQRE